VLISDFNFDLPEELIAQQPAEDRSDSRMLTVDRASGGWKDERFIHFPDLLTSGDVLVLNNSRVIPARLFAQRATPELESKEPIPNEPSANGKSPQPPTGPIEVLLTEQVSRWEWRALVKPGRKVRLGERLLFKPRIDSLGTDAPGTSASGTGAIGITAPGTGATGIRPTGTGPTTISPISIGATEAEGAATEALTAEVIDRGDYGERTLRFTPTATEFLTLLESYGHIPLPPYIHRDDTASDRSRYQTVYAEHDGSVAVPTAGLHFTPDILDQIRSRGVHICYVTLHVGLGTFQPLRVERVEDIHLHAERYALPEETATQINAALAEGRRIIAVGTTTVRTLEHCAQIAGSGKLYPHSGSTSIFISPGYSFKIISALLTNFHLPQSSLLMLVSAFAGLQILAAYRHAVAERYRFFSYGDCMFIS
jgi:S-adenosylmethionine:tRNA ribosyltransferase-isomerase